MATMACALCIASCNRDAVREQEAADLRPSCVEPCSDLPALCASNLRGQPCTPPSPDCTLVTNGPPLHCECSAIWRTWVCQDYRCKGFSGCPLPEENVICSNGGFEAVNCKCIHPERQWACYLTSEAGFGQCVPERGPFNGQPCYCSVTGNIYSPTKELRCACEDDHWRCEMPDGG